LAFILPLSDGRWLEVFSRSFVVGFLATGDMVD